MMEEKLKERLVGAAVLTAVGVIFIPMIFEGRPKSEQAPVTKPQVVFESPILPAEHVPHRVDPVEVKPAVEPVASPDQPRHDVRVDPISGKAPEPLPKVPKAEAPEVLPDRPAADAIRSGWVVQLASFSREANARNLRAKLVAKGFAAYIEQTGSMYRVRVGPTSGQQQARDLREALKLAVNLQGVVVRHP